MRATVTQIGRSTGLILPKEAVARLKAKKEDMDSRIFRLAQEIRNPPLTGCRQLFSIGFRESWTPVSLWMMNGRLNFMMNRLGSLHFLDCPGIMKNHNIRVRFLPSPHP